MTGTRRGSGEGSVYREPSGLWCASVELEREGGRRRRKYVRAKSKRAVLERLTQLRSDVARGAPLPGRRRTTGEYLEWWLSHVLAGTVKEGTEASYRFVVKRYVSPHIGATPLSKLGPEHVLKMLRALEAAGLSPRTQQLARAVLRRALSHAERWEYVSRNVAALVDAPKSTSSRVDDAMTAAEARAVLASAHGDRLEALAELVLSVGLRKGEALALRWSDVDLAAGRATVRGTLKRRQGGGWTIDTPKTKSGHRVVPLTAHCVQALRQHRHAQHQEQMASLLWQNHDLVFSSSIGTPLDERNVTRWWHDLTIRAGVGRRRFHSSRHTAATLMLAQGIPLEVVSATLGHAGLAITADVYARVQLPAQRSAAEAMDRALHG